MHRSQNKSIECPYDMFSNPAPVEGKIYLHPRAVGKRPTNAREIVKRMYRDNTSRQIETEAIINHFLDEVSDALCNGNSVHIPGLGTLHVTLQGPKKVTDPDKVRAEHIKLSGISLTPDRRLMRDMKQSIHFVRSKEPNHSLKLDMMPLIDIMADYFQKSGNKSLTSGTLEQFYDIKKGKAQRLISQAIADNLICNVAPTKSNPVYTPDQELREYMES